MIIPNKIKNILEKDQASDGLVKSVITTFEPILNSELFFLKNILIMVLIILKWC